MLGGHYTVGAILASALALVLLLWRWRRRPTDGVARREGPFDSGTDVIVVGAGVAGAALAHTLGMDGRRVHVIERDLREPDSIVGELLQPGGYLKLIDLGLQDCVEGIDSQEVLGYALYKDGKHTKLSYRKEKFQADVLGKSFHNGHFIQKLREKAASQPNGFDTKLIERWNGAKQECDWTDNIDKNFKTYILETSLPSGFGRYSCLNFPDSTCLDISQPMLFVFCLNARVHHSS